MKLSELIDILHEIESEFPDSDPIVTLMQQQSWPLETHISAVKILHVGEDDERKVTILEGSFIGYGSKEDWS